MAFDVTNRESFRNVRTWIASIHKTLGNDVMIPKILVGNKIDLREEIQDKIDCI